MIHITNFAHILAERLPKTAGLLSASNLVVHRSVSRITLHGSRGPAGGYRSTSDIDLSLIVDELPALPLAELDSFLREVLETTHGHWRSRVALDLAIVFETQPCGLRCFDHVAWEDEFCAIGGVDCFGLYKLGKGFNGFVTNAQIQVKRMYPCFKIWQKE